MSISTQIIRLQSAKAGIKTAIEGKGVTVDSAATLSDYPTLIDSIQQGDGASSNDWIQFVEKEDYTATTFDVKQAITSVDIPSGVTSVIFSCFANCSGLTSVTIPNTVTSLQNSCFTNCINLSSVTIHAETPPTLASGAFTNTNANLILFVPAGSVEDYKAASNWSAYETKIQAIPNE